MPDSQPGRSARLKDDTVQASTVIPAQSEPAPSQTQQAIALQRRLHTIDPLVIASAHKKKRRLIYMALAALLVAVGIYIALSFVPACRDAVRPFRYALLLTPICLVLALKQFSNRLARSHPLAAQRLCSSLTFGKPQATCHVASMYMDSGDFSKAEKLLTGASKVVRANNIADYITVHSYLAAARARAGKLAQGQKIIAETVQAAETLYETRATRSVKLVLAVTLNNAAEVAAEAQEIGKAFDLSERAVSTLIDCPDPPLDILLSCLTNAGHYANIAGQSKKALCYLEKAQQLIENTDDCRLTCAASVYANLGFAHSQTRDFAKSAQSLEQALVYLGTVAARKELPSVHKLIAEVHAAAGQLEEAGEEYKSAIRASQLHNPKVTYTSVHLQEDYATFLRNINRDGAAAAAELQAVQARYVLDQNDTAPSPTKSQLKQEAVKVARSKGRFPIFCLLATGLYGFLVVLGGLRVAHFSTWVWFIGFATVLGIKLRAKYGPPSNEETHSAIVAVAAHLPFARYVVPELSVLPQRTAMVFLLTAACALVGVKLTQPAPDTVPNGFTTYEYNELARRLAAAESFDKAADAWGRVASAGGPLGELARFNEKTVLPRYPQPPEAIAINKKAFELRRKDPKQAQALWEECAQKYTNFEYPLIHLSALYELDSSPSGLKKADEAAGKALAINPDNFAALTQMYTIKSMEHQDTEAQKYLQRQLDAMPEQTAALQLLKALKGRKQQAP